MSFYLVANDMTNSAADAGDEESLPSLQRPPSDKTTTNTDSRPSSLSIKPNDSVSIFQCLKWNWPAIVYLSIFSIIGVTTRSFIGRLFGGDCDSIGDPIDDWLYPLSHQICITASGRTEQHGGALFIDLPENMLGSFIMVNLC